MSSYPTWSVVNLLHGNSLFVILVNFHAEYEKTIDKVKSASGFSLRLAISRTCASVKDGNDGGRYVGGGKTTTEITDHYKVSTGKQKKHLPP